LNPGNLPPPSVTSAKRFTTISAIQLFNIKYKNERYLFEIALYCFFSSKLFKIQLLEYIIVISY